MSPVDGLKSSSDVEISKRRPKKSLSATLLLMLLAPVVPLLILSIAALVYQWDMQVREAHQSIAETALLASIAVDREIDRSRAMLETLAASELIDARDWRA